MVGILDIIMAFVEHTEWIAVTLIVYMICKNNPKKMLISIKDKLIVMSEKE